MEKIFKKSTERCPNCSSKRTMELGPGEQFYMYYHCMDCHHDFTVNLAKYINLEKERDVNAIQE